MSFLPKRPAFSIAVLALATATLSTEARATVVWNWSFDGERGTFTTDGVATGGSASSGTYNFQDFSVTASAAGESIGSVGGSQYAPGGFSTETPYSFDWNGSAVTQWHHSGSNIYAWWAFNDVDTGHEYLFAETSANVNDPTNAILYNAPSFETLASGRIAVSVSTVPLPAGVGLFATALLGLFGMAGARRRSIARGAA